MVAQFVHKALHELTCFFLHFKIQWSDLFFKSQTAMNPILDKSSSLLSEGDLSLFLQHAPSQSEIQIQQLLKQLSQVRTQMREVKQDNQWYRTNNQGLESECQALKQLLQEKKQMLIQANSQLKNANDEINRLEDEMYLKSQQIQRYQNEVQSKDAIIREQTQKIIELSQTAKEKQLKIEELKKNIEKVQTQSKKQKQQYFTELNQKLQTMIERQNIKEFSGLQKIKPSPHKNETIFIKIEEAMHKNNEQLRKAEQNIEEQSQEIYKLRDDKQNLKNRLEEALQALEETQKCHNMLEMTVRESERKLQTNLSKSNEGYKQLQIHHTQTINQLIDMFKPMVKGEQELLLSIGEIMKLEKPHRQVLILMDEMKGVIVQKNFSSSRSSETLKELKDEQRKYKILLEELETLRLKHLTLEREYEAIMEDNRRVIKFHKLSRYRVDRNMGVRKEKQLASSGDKENRSHYANY